MRVVVLGVLTLALSLNEYRLRFRGVMELLVFEGTENFYLLREKKPRIRIVSENFQIISLAAA